MLANTMTIMLNFMIQSKQLSLNALCIITSVVVLLFASCTSDANFAEGYLPDSQEIDLQQSEFQWSNSLGEDIFSVRLYQTDRTKMSNVGRVSIGAERDTLFGDRLSGFYSQYTPLSNLDEDGFGLDVMLDSVMIYFNLYEYHGDIETSYTYEVREVINDDFIRNSADTVFSVMSVDSLIEIGVLGDVLFEFDYPNENHPIDYDTDSISMDIITDAGYDLLNGLMLKERSSGLQIDYNIYDSDNHDIFVDNFKGLTIMPKAFSDEEMPSGATYGIVLEMSGWGFYGRCKMEDDPTLISDTVSMTYVFRDASLYSESTNDDYLNAPGGVSINLIERDLTTAMYDISTVGSENGVAEATIDTLYVEGMGGVVSQITLEKALFEELDRVMATRNAELDEDFDNIFINAARLRLYITGMSDYQSVINGVYAPLDVYSAYSSMPARLGLYSNFGTLTDDSGDTELVAVSDYNYLYEVNYSIYTDYDGSLNRSLGCYEMNIPLHLQGLWAQWRAAVEAAGSADAVDWSTITWNKLYVAPLAEDLFTVHRLILQGAPLSDESAGAPIRLMMTYTLIKS